MQTLPQTCLNGISINRFVLYMYRVLEASSRVGGRTFLAQVPVGDGRTETFDLGGQWVASSQTHVMKLIEELGLDTYEQ